ncbi:MAG: hypothetical protein AMJ59_00525 [Gammaproteobacteria bacterium SG8_31]|jgi:uncharacterized protein (TIGR00369 family)|nr:MAG: hypothetical protein AMJ59_00525 [Gammaproteobacteria bacterium SG8_31]
MSGMSHEEIGDWFANHFPNAGKRLHLESVGPGRARLRLKAGRGQLRPGGTVSGPSMMMLADAAVYAALLAMDREAGDAVTSNFNIAFLSRPEAGDVIAEAELLSVGRRLAVAEVRLHPADQDTLVAQATVTYVRS